MALVQLLLLSSVLLSAQRQAGELRLTVTDASGLPLDATVTIASQATAVERKGPTDNRGQYVAPALPFGPYSVTVERTGWTPYRALVHIRSEAPLEERITLSLAAVETTVTVEDAGTLLDPSRTGSTVHVGQETIDTRPATTPSRGVLELVNRQPGWLLEANGVLHPRGAEYDTQYVVDGIPITDNRSPAFAPAFDAEEISAMRVLTAGYPAEYGRKMGGIVELSTRRDGPDGLRTRAAIQGGSFDSRSAYLATQGTISGTTAGVSAQASSTHRFLDPPTTDNFSNRGSASGVTAHIQHQLSAADRFRLYIHRKQNAFLVPNELEQQIGRQRQDRRGEETMGQASWSRVLSPRWLLDARGMSRDVAARLWSNELATPIIADQDRGFRELYFNGSISGNPGRHALKAGGEFAGVNVREQFGYRITNPAFFAEDDDEDPEVPLTFRFNDRRKGREYAAFVQDVIRAGNLTVSAGIRWDRYRLLVTENFVSPRLGAAWNVPRAGLVLRTSYDRAITTPAIENLLLAGSSAAQGLTDETSGLTLRPSRGNFYEVGFSKSILGRMRLDGSCYRREIRNFADDDVFLNTGISFPVSFDRASITGFELRLELPRTGRFSGFASYSNLSGVGFLPLTGGLFLEEEAQELLASRDRFRISQDQRNTLQTRLRYDVTSRVWTAFAYWYNSGLPVESADEIKSEYVDADRRRVKPSWSADLSAGLHLWTREARSVTLQFDMLNLTDRVNPINVAGLFSGTAIGPPRAFYVRIRTVF